MPVPFAPLFAFAFGAALAWVGRRELVRRDGALIGTRLLAAAALYGALAVAPATAYFAWFHGDWAYLYALPSRRVPSAVDLLAVLAAAACVPLGALVAAPHARARRARAVQALAAGPALALAVAAAACARRLLASATYAQYHGRFGVEPLHAAALGKGLVVMGALLLFGGVLTAREVRRA